MTADTDYSSTPNLSTAHLITSFGTLSKAFPNVKAVVELLSFSSELLLHQSYNKNGICGSFTFHKSKLHIICINLLLNSVLEDPFHDFHSMFQQFNSSVRSTLHWIPFPFVIGNTILDFQSSGIQSSFTIPLHKSVGTTAYQ